MSDETISPLRRRMIEDMTVRNFSADTQRNYIRSVKNLAVFLGRSPIPVVLSPEEVARLLEAAPGPKYKAALSAAYGAGLRVSEVVALKVSDVDSRRMLLRIEQGKGRRDRHAMLSPQLLELLRACQPDLTRVS
jgi:integrase